MSPILILAIKALVGGTVVLAFAAIGELLRPRGLAGMFAAAPSVALAGLAAIGVIIWHRSMKGSIAYGPYLAAGALIELLKANTPSP